jgi:trimeric autotransporter adhesin
MLSGSSRARWSVCAVAALLASFACGSSSQTSVSPSAVRCAVQGQADNTSFPADGGAGTLRVSTERECTWSVQTEARWIVFPQEPRGQGEGSVRFTIAANADPASRVAPISVNEQRMQISQAGRPCQLQLSSTHESLPSAGGQRTVLVEASSGQCSWAATTDVAWITVLEGQTGAGNGAVVFQVTATSGPVRTGALTIGEQRVTIEQGGACTYATGATTVDMNPSGGRAEVPVLAPSGCAWTSTSNVPWITIINGQTGNGNGAVVFTVEAAAGPPRTGTLTVAGQTVRIEQGSGCTYATGVTAIDVNASGGTIDVPVLAPPGCAWTAASQAPWLEIASGGNGSGGGVVRVSVRATDGPLRSGTVTAAGVTVTFTQASGCRPGVEPQTHAAPAAGGSSSVTVQAGAGCPWSAASDAPWITLSQTSGTAPAQVAFTVAANNTPPRSGALTVAGHTVTVSQESSCTWRIVPAVLDYDANGGGGSVLVIVVGGCAWTAASTADWITLQVGHSGAGDGLVQFIVASNAGAARTGIVKIAGIDLLVRQAAR